MEKREFSLDRGCNVPSALHLATVALSALLSAALTSSTSYCTTAVTPPHTKQVKILGRSGAEGQHVRAAAGLGCLPRVRRGAGHALSSGGSSAVALASDADGVHHAAHVAVQDGPCCLLRQPSRRRRCQVLDCTDNSVCSQVQSADSQWRGTWHGGFVTCWAARTHPHTPSERPVNNV